MLDETIWTLSVLIAGFAGASIARFFGSYTSEKGKNLATKEDIRHITTEIENIKVAIHTLGQLKTDYEQQRREHHLSFYDSAVEILYDKLSVSFGDFPPDGGKSLFEYQQQFGVIVGSLLKEYQRIVLYFEHEHAVRICAEEVVNTALRAGTIVRKRFGEIKITFVEEVDASKSDDKQRYIEAVEESDKANIKFWSEMRPVIDAFQNSLRSYLTAVNKFLREGSEIR